MSKYDLIVRIRDNAPIEIQGDIHLSLLLFDLSPHRRDRRFSYEFNNETPSLIYQKQNLQQFIFSGIDYNKVLLYKETMQKEIYSINQNPLMRKNINILIYDDNIKLDYLNRFLYKDGIYIISNYDLYAKSVVVLRKIYANILVNNRDSVEKSFQKYKVLYNIEANEGTLIKDALVDLFKQINLVSRMKINYTNIAKLSVDRARDLFNNIMQYINHNGVFHNNVFEIYNTLDKLVEYINRNLSNKYVNTDYVERVYMSSEIMFYRKINIELEKTFHKYLEVTKRLNKDLSNLKQIEKQYPVNLDKKYMYRDIPLKEKNPIFQDYDLQVKEFMRIIQDSRVNKKTAYDEFKTYLLNAKDYIDIEENKEIENIIVNLDQERKEIDYTSKLAYKYVQRYVHPDIVSATVLLNSYKVMTSLYTPVNELIHILLKCVINELTMGRKLILIREIIKSVLDQFNHEAKEKNYLMYYNLEMIFGYRYDKTDKEEVNPLIEEWTEPNPKETEQRKFFSKWFPLAIKASVSENNGIRLINLIANNSTQMNTRYGCLGQWINLFNASGSAKNRKIEKIQLTKTRYFESSAHTKSYYFNDVFLKNNVKDTDNSILIKNEAVKKRTVVNTSVESYIPLTKISAILTKLFKRSINMYPVYMENERMMFFERIQKYLSYNMFVEKRYLVLPLDYSSFDRTISAGLIDESIKQLLNIMPNCLGKEILNNNYRIFFDMLSRSYLSYDINGEKGQIKYKTGVLSGWKITNIIESYINYIMSYGVLRDLGLDDNNIKEIVTMGDDIVIVIDIQNVNMKELFNLEERNKKIKREKDKDLFSIENKERILQRISYKYEQIGFIVHKSKNMISFNFCEFLRNAYYCSIVEGYSIRSILNLVYKKPTGEIEINDISILSQNLNKVCRRIGITAKYAYFLKYFMSISNNKNLRDNIKYADYPERYNVVSEMSPKRRLNEKQFKEIYQKYESSDYIGFLMKVADNVIKQIYLEYGYKIENLDIKSYMTKIKEYIIKRLMRNNIMLTRIEVLNKKDRNHRFIYSVKKVLDEASLLVAKNHFQLMKQVSYKYPVNDYHAIELYEIIAEVFKFTSLHSRKMILYYIYNEYSREFKYNRDAELRSCLDLMINKNVMNAIIGSFKIPGAPAKISNVMASYFRKVLTALCYYYAINEGCNDLLSKKTFDYLTRIAVSLTQEQMFNYAMQTRYSIVPSGFMMD